MRRRGKEPVAGRVGDRHLRQNVEREAARRQHHLALHLVAATTPKRRIERRSA